MRRKGKAPHRPTTAEWRAAARQALKDLDEDQVWLAGRLRVKPATVSVILTGRVKSSSLVDEISEVLKIGRPEFVDQRDQSDLEKLRELRKVSPDGYLRVGEMIDRYLSAAGSGPEDPKVKK